MKEKFVDELAELINRHGIDNDLNAPDWCVADLLVNTLNAQIELRNSIALISHDDQDDDCDCHICRMSIASEAKEATRTEQGQKEYRKPRVSDAYKEIANIIEIVKKAMPNAKIEVAGFGVVRDNRNPRARRRNKNKCNKRRSNETR